MLTGQSQLDDKLQGLESGADIYLVKPIDMRELIGCINALWRRIQPEAQDLHWHLDMKSRWLTAPDKKALGLTQQEVVIFQLLQSSPDEIVSRQQITRVLNIEHVDVPDYRINMLMSRLRQKFSNFDALLVIQTWRNLGYSYIGPEVIQRS